MRELNIIVCVKPVPDPRHWDKITLDPVTKTSVRQGIPSILDRLDKCAIETALRLREQSGGKVRIVSMAPPSVADNLMETLAMGADEVYLLSDRAFGGADVMATVRTIAAGIRKIGPFDLIICGAYSSHGSTGQVGPELASYLQVPHASYVSAIESLTDDSLTVVSNWDDGHMVVDIRLPALLTVVKEINEPRGVSLLGLVAARGRPFTTWSLPDIGLTPDQVGLTGSPTSMLDMFTPSHERRGQVLEGKPDEVADELLRRLAELALLPKE
ncbi:MAG: electron transfer flavoprotein subunit beta/FixA family protein [Chloroflexota bacterium]